ncbi:MULTISPECIES: hypothetical protein [Staphylococcus]|uniref:Uncharacterized protein n=2 Tax=Staphylococcus TaxID=1279 RepID=A0ABZ3EFA5_9STAP|nr:MULTISPECIES: hypothetical protein [unclassified Staphylococcus]
MVNVNGCNDYLNASVDQTTITTKTGSFGAVNRYNKLYHPIHHYLFCGQ